MINIFKISVKTFNCNNDFHVCFLAPPLSKRFFFFLFTLAAQDKDFPLSCLLFHSVFSKMSANNCHLVSVKDNAGGKGNTEIQYLPVKTYLTINTR